uniref:Essential for reactive oxygen species protein n=1 Tax=Ailuropoda melanoleuca TaxID=9646 RepID=A0A7N5KN40_AILME
RGLRASGPGLCLLGPALEGQLRGADGIGRLKSGVAVPSAARLWSIFPVTLHVSACLLCHVVILYIHLVFILHHVLLGAKPLLSGSSVWSPVSSGTLGRGTYSGNTVNGILSIGLAAAYYSGDSLGWKLFYVTGCLFVAVQNLEDWEEAVFNKSTGQVVLKTFSLYRKLLTLFRAGHDQVVVLLNDIRDVNVEEEKIRYFGKGYVVVLRFVTGFSHPLTQNGVMGHRSDVEAIAKLIATFLELHGLESPVELSQSSDSEADGPGSQS